MDRSQTLERLRELGLLAVVRGESREAAVEVSEALVEGGVLGIEITFTTPEAHLAIRDLRDRHGGRIFLGAGTVQAHQGGAPSGSTTAGESEPRDRRGGPP